MKQQFIDFYLQRASYAKYTSYANRYLDIYDSLKVIIVRVIKP